MDEPIKDLFTNLNEKVIGYLPNLLGGLLLIGVGLLLGWLVKRVLIQLFVMFHLDRILQRSRWGEDLTRADVRHAVYNFLGNLALIVVFLIFLNDALNILNLTVLSNFLQSGILILPKILGALIIFVIGVLITSFVSTAIQKALRKEEVPRATLIARFSKTILLLFFSAMALAELNIAREVVVIGFTVIFITLGILTIVVTAIGGRPFVRKILEHIEE